MIVVVCSGILRCTDLVDDNYGVQQFPEMY